MSADGREIANYVLDYCELNGRKVSHLSLQKIVFFCHAWSLVKLGRPLVKHQFEAWQFGPVLPYLYRQFKAFDDTPIVGRATKLDPATGEHKIATYALEKETEELLASVVDFYSRLSSSELVKLSHVEGGPWYVAWNHDGKVNPGMKIDDTKILHHYSRANAADMVQ